MFFRDLQYFDENRHFVINVINLTTLLKKTQKIIILTLKKKQEKSIVTAIESEHECDTFHSGTLTL